ncbi:MULTISPECIES: hypothetical protein [unclassified Devosia]|uniref:hypothetical protein n=1 Tax=unclassified Devosia TaxID=196773 RepID=UPI0015FA024F|nr:MULTISPECIES: hypothetical protein [unclassified Devosia]MBJ6986948.1 hypothetical protein [Devosia sp. MC521]MBK1793355.1 hypothetical protein [Devosia sp. WQ 349K1]QMW63972.1 hypothetical protein H4N61_06550 [Devosia sp. MC521]
MLPLVVRELAEGRRVAVAVLFEFEFASGTQRFTDREGYLTVDGHEWLGLGQLLSVSGLEQSVKMSAPQATFMLSGVDAFLVSVAANGSYEATGRPCAVYLQFLTEAGTSLDSKIAIWAGVMDTPRMSARLGQQAISLTAETLFVDRVRAPWGLQTDTDQQARWPGDRGFEFAPSLLFKTVNWLRA